MTSSQRMAYLAALNSNSRMRVGCVISTGGRILASGCNNMSKSNAFVRKYSSLKKTHAEVRALMNLRFNVDKRCIPHICRVLRNGKVAMARPCPICMDIMKFSGIKKICYTIDSFPYWKEEVI